MTWESADRASLRARAAQRGRAAAAEYGPPQKVPHVLRDKRCTRCGRSDLTGADLRAADCGGGAPSS